MKANEAPERLYFDEREDKGILDIYSGKESDNDIEYIRTDVIIERATQFLYDYNQKQVIKHGARATLGCGEYTINVDEFINYIKGE